MVKGILVKPKVKDSQAPLKMDHADLVAEMHTVENLPTHERLQLARVRRAQQLKVARQKEKEWLKQQRSPKTNPNLVHSNRAIRHISFENSVVLLEAASRNDIQEVADLLQRGITPDAANEDGLTALHQCCIDNNVEMLKLLLDYGANVDAQDSDKWTPLHAAATCGHLNLVKILISRGANLLAVNTDGNMPYDLCDDEDTLDYIEAEMSKRGVTQELIDETRALTEKQMLSDLMEVAKNGGDLEEPDMQGATPLHIASANGYNRVVEFLLELHVNVDAVDKDLWSPVHAAACWGHMEVLEMLAQFGADLNARNKDDETPSDICEDPEIRERIEQLRTEQESKRLAEAQRRRVRRSQSNNTRAQSVRRTSLRDKTLTTKKDAVEEARLRLQAQEVFVAPDSTTDVKSINPAGGGDATSATTHTQVPNTNTTTTTAAVDSLTIITASKRRCSLGSATSRPSADQVNGVDGGGMRSHESLVNNNPNGILNGAPPLTQSSSINNNNNGTGLVNGGSSYYPTTYDNVDGTTTTTSSLSLNNSQRRPPEGKDNDEFHLRNEKIGLSNSVGGSLHKLSGDRSTEIFQATKENGKINVQVTVLVDTQNLDNALTGATLANLKKQRSQSRTNVLGTENGSVIGASSSSATHQSAPQLNMSGVTTSQPTSMEFSLSPSVNSSTGITGEPTTTATITKFSGITGDVVSDSTRSKKCCLLM